MKNLFKLVLLAVVVTLCACQSRELNTKISHATGWNYYDESSTNFQALEGDPMGIPTGMVAIEGGSFTIGERDEFITAPRDNVARTLTVSSFYMDKYEITNLDWREYLHWYERVFGLAKYSKDSIMSKNIIKSILPDTTVWLEELAYNEPYFQYYFRHPAYSFYPVVGVSWTQAMAYCQWRTDRVNELALYNSGAIEFPPFDQLRLFDPNDEMDSTTIKDWGKNYPGFSLIECKVKDPDDPNKDTLITKYVPSYEWIRDRFTFNTEKYLYVNTYNPTYGKKPFTNEWGENRKVNTADGILVVGYRLPTEAEWEFAAYAPVAAAADDGLSIEGKVYPWSGYHPRSLNGKTTGQLQANFIRGRGDMMGMSKNLNDAYVITAPVDAFAPNDFGLYNMAGNVNEWVMDVYRETSSMEVTEYNPFRGNIYTHPKRDSLGRFSVDSIGCVGVVFEEKVDDKRDYRDGDFPSRLTKTEYPLDTLDTTWLGKIEDRPKAIKKDPTDILVPRFSKDARVYKGGSWNDRVYWINPSSRRFLDQHKSSSTIGFRCAMSKLGENRLEMK